MIDITEIQTILEKLGFSEKEAQIYLILLELNEALPSAIARKANLKRPTTYLVLEQLQKKGLVSSVKKEGTLFYRATKPEVFIENEEQQLKNNQAALEVLSQSLPELASLHEKYSATPQMSVFHGKEGLIQIMEDTLTTKGNILCWSNTDLAVNTLLKDYHPSYVSKKIKRGIWSKCLFLEDEMGIRFKERSKKELREVHFLPENEYPFGNEINIYDDKVSIISHDDQVGVIIQNKNIANTQRAIFELCFKLCSDKL
jgi:sugar-specific transcriptional regulator TrmB